MNNPLSFSSLKLDRFSKDGIRLKPASGFVVEADNQYYLITNQHVVSGKDIPDDKLTGPAIGPYTLKTSVHIHRGAGENSLPLSTGMRKELTIQLYDDNDAPRWIETQANKQRQPMMIDVIAIPIQLNQILGLLSKLAGSSADAWAKISAIPASAIDVEVAYGPPDTVHIIGYPLGWAPAGTNKASMAFWRTSSIASEINEAGVIPAGIFFVDPSAQDGMTGSPVISMKNGQMKLLGVYSDSSTAEFGANAGLVWGASVIKDLIDIS